MRKKQRCQPEFEFHCVVADYLNRVLPGEARWYHIPNGEYRTPATAGRLKRMGVKPGVPDIVVLWKATSTFFELKAAGGKESEVQKDWSNWLWANGFPAFVVTTLEEIEAILLKRNVALKGRIS